MLDNEPTVVEVAPSPQTTPLLQRLTARHVISVDFDPAADGRRVDVQASLTDLPFQTGSVDLLLCFHVLEHIPDDRAGMSEIARVLSDRGMAVIQVPWRPQSDTDEDPEAPPRERVRRFGQADHVRYYGGDFESRLLDAGLDVHRSTAGALLGAAQCRWAGIGEEDCIWVARRARRRLAVLTVRPAGVLSASIDASSSAQAELRQQQNRRVRRLRRQVGRLKEELRDQSLVLHVQLRLPASVTSRLRRRLPEGLRAAFRDRTRSRD